MPRRDNELRGSGETLPKDRLEVAAIKPYVLGEQLRDAQV